MFSRIHSLLADRVHANILIQVAGRGVILLCSLALVTMLTRLLGPEGYGTYVIVMTWLSILCVIIDLGLNMVGVREMSLHKNRRQELFQAVFSLKLLYAAAAALVGCVVIFVTSYNAVTNHSLLLSYSVFLSLAVFESFRTVKHAQIQMASITACDVLASIIILSVAAVVLFLQMNVIAVIAGVVVANAAKAGLMAFYARHDVRFRLAWPTEAVKTLFLQSLPLGISGVLATVYMRLDLIMLSAIKPAEDVAVYGAAYKLIEVLLILPVVAFGTMFPLFSRAVNGPREELVAQYNKGFQFFAVMSLPLAVGGALVADPLMTLITGRDFADFAGLGLTSMAGFASTPAGLALKILLFVVPLMFIGQLHGHMLIAKDLVRHIILIYFFVLPLNAALNALVIPAYSFVGASLVTVATEVIALVLTTWLMHSRFQIMLPLQLLVKPFVATLAMAAFVLGIPLPVTASITLGACVYGGVLYFLGGVEFLTQRRR